MENYHENLIHHASPACCVANRMRGFPHTPPSLIPDGTYTTSITTEEQTSAGVSPTFACENAGAFTLTVSGHRWDVVQSAAPGCTVLHPRWSGSWEIAGKEVAFRDDRSYGCTTTYSYNWTFDGTELRFTTIDDPCAQRVVIQTSHPWVMQK